MSASISTIQSDIQAAIASGKTLLTKVTALETLTNTIFTQLQALIAANAGTGTVSVADLEALHTGLVQAKADADAASASIDATIAADTPAAPAAPAAATEPAASATEGTPAAPAT